MAFIGRNSDGTIYGIWSVRQPNDAAHPRQEEVPDDHPDVVAFLAPKAAIDLSNVDNLGKALKAMALCVAQVGGLTVPQLKALFKQKWDALP